jgi:hypothetical protein
MARVSGVKEKVHSPLYDAFFVPGVKNGTGAKTFKDVMTDPRVIRFFVDIQNKTRLETNLQASGVLPSLNTFEARAMRVVASTFCVPETALKHPDIQKAIIRAAEKYRSDNGQDPAVDPPQQDKDQLVNSIRAAIEKLVGSININEYVRTAIVSAAETFRTSAIISPLGSDITNLTDQIIDSFEAGCDASSTFLSELIFNSVSTLLVGEKTMIEMPTFWFPAGAGVNTGNGNVMNHGEPDPMATFRFAEPVTIEPQQSFRVEMQFPQDVPRAVATASGPLRIWVVLDGYLTRDVQ